MGTLFFAAAVLHSLLSSKIHHWFSGLASRRPRLVHWLSEIELIFGLWCLPLFATFVLFGQADALVRYLRSIHYFEPVLVFCVFVVAGSQPVLAIVGRLVVYLGKTLAALTRVPVKFAELFVILAACPLAGSLITEPAAMAVAAPLLSQMIHKRDQNLLYLIVAVLFVNISIGGALTHFAAPPILMVARPWGWTTPDVFVLFGTHAIAGTILTALLTLLFMRKKVSAMFVALPPERLNWKKIKIFPLRFKEGGLIALFLTSLLIFGPMQTWWIEPVLRTLDGRLLYLVSTLLTGMVDNAALTYLGAQVPDLSADSKYFLVAGAISGGGLTLIANAPNIVGLNLLRPHFPNGFDSKKLFVSALLPTFLIALIFAFL